MAITIERVGTYIPETTLQVAELRDYLGLTDNQVHAYRRFLGYQRIVVADGIAPLQLLLAAARPALRGVRPADVRQVIFAHALHEVAPPQVNLTAQVRTALGLHHATGFAMSQQNCATGLYAVLQAGHLMAGQPASAKSLVVMGERAYCPQMRCIPNIALLGEASVAVLVGRDGPGDTVLSSSFRSRGQFYQGVTIDAARLKELNACYASTLSTVITEALDRAGLGIGDVARVIPHNVTRLSWHGVAKALGIPMSRIFLDLAPELGHVYCADPFLNLDAARRAGRLRPADIAVLACVGIGATFGALVLRIGEHT